MPYLSHTHFFSVESPRNEQTRIDSLLTTGRLSHSVLTQLADFMLRSSVALILLWYGVFKFTPAEAKAIEGLLTHSPLFAWMLTLFSLQTVSDIIGSVEIFTALTLLIPYSLSRGLARTFCLAGGVLGIVTFLSTLSFLVTTPNTFKVIDGILVPAGAGGFIIKDIVLLAVCVHYTLKHYGATQEHVVSSQSHHS